MNNSTLKKEWEFKKDKDLYPGATGSVLKMASSMTTSNPVSHKTTAQLIANFINSAKGIKKDDLYLQAQILKSQSVLNKGYDACE